MLKKLTAYWDQFFFGEKPSVSLGFFRIAVAVTIGTHVIPTLLVLPDNYLHTAFKERNGSFFPIWILRVVAQSSDSLVYVLTGLFYVFWFLFLIGFCTQASCVLMAFTCYYFYALNSLHVGTLSWDILLVTVFVMCLTKYPGDYFSVDAWLRSRKNPGSQLPARPFFIQRLLQLQLSWTYFYTALGKIFPGNWLQANPYYYLMNNPAGSVVREFWPRTFLASHPTLCYGIGLSVIAGEILVAFGLFAPRFWKPAVALGILFHFLLLYTLHVPTIFFFLFIPQFLLFIPPENMVRKELKFRP